MERTLQTEGVLNDQLYCVPEQLVPNYNRALEAAIGRTTSLREFHVDKRGESPELEEELGWNYLQRGRSDRYLIIISPEQRTAGLLHEEFSFDDEVLDLLYEQYLSGIEVVTRVDGLWGELDDGLAVIQSLQDLLMLGRISVALRTPSGFLNKARDLQRLVQQLQVDPDLLIRNDSSHLKNIHDLAEEVGDVRNCNLAGLSLSHEITSYYTRLFGGVYLFREGMPALDIHRPDGDQDRQHSDGDTHHTVVIYSKREQRDIGGPSVTFLPVSGAGRVLDWLQQSGRATYSADLVDRRLEELEDEALAESGWKFSRNKRGRKQALSRIRDSLPREWHRLLDLKRGLSAGHPFNRLVRKAGISVKKMLLAPTSRNGRAEPVVENLLTKLWPGDYARTWRSNRHDLERIFNGAPEWKQDHILRVIREKAD